MKQKSYSVSFIANLNNKFPKKNDLLAGEWCLDRIITKKNFFKKKNVNISSRENNRNIYKEAKLCDKYYDRLLLDIISHFEKIHSFGWSKRSWEIFLGPWLNRYVSVIYDRYHTISYILQKYKVNEVKLIKDEKYNLVEQNLLNFRIISQDDKWNLKLFSKIYLKFFDTKEVKKKYLKIKFKKFTFGYEPVKKLNPLMLKINQFFNSIIKKYKTLFNLVFYKTSINNKIAILFLMVKRKKFLLPYQFGHKIPNLKYVSKKRTEKISSKFKLSKFEIVLRKLLFELIPFYYLESIDNLIYLRKKLILPPDTNCNIFTSNSLWLDGIFKFWLADVISKQTKLNCFQHGCNYGSTKYAYCEKTEVKLSDRFFSWGWSENNKKIKKFYATKTLFKNEFSLNRNNKILVVLSNCHNYTSYHNTGTFSSKRSLIYFDLIKKICQFSKRKSNIFFRLPPNDKISFNLEKKLINIYGNLNFEKKENDFINSCKKYELILHTQDSTGFLETMTLNKPSMIILSSEIYKKNFREDAEKYYKKLEKVNIAFSSFEKYYKFISNKSFNTYDWWNNKKTRRTRYLFCERFCKKTKYPLEAINKIIK